MMIKDTNVPNDIDIQSLFISAKQFLSIAESSKLKDKEITTLICAGIQDLERCGVNTSLQDSLIETAILMFVKSNFGNVNIKEKELARRSYDSLSITLASSSFYRKEE